MRIPSNEQLHLGIRTLNNKKINRKCKSCEEEEESEESKKMKISRKEKDNSFLILIFHKMLEKILMTLQASKVLLLIHRQENLWNQNLDIILLM